MSNSITKAKAAAAAAATPKTTTSPRAKRRYDEKDDANNTRVTKADISKAIYQIEGKHEKKKPRLSTPSNTTPSSTTSLAAHKSLNAPIGSQLNNDENDENDENDDDNDEFEDDEVEVKMKGKVTKNGKTATSSTTSTTTSSKWINKQRVLVLCSRGVTFRARHLINDLRTLMPHSKKDVKLDKKDKINIVNEVCELKNCNNCLFLEMRKKQDMYLWLSKTPSGPSVKFHIESINTMDELRMTGNCLKGSRPILSFDKTFDTLPHFSLLKELFIQIFGTPKGHPKSKPFFDRVMTFSVADNRIWFRNFQIIDQPVEKGKTETSLNEIGPRFVLNIVRIFDGSFGGATIYENPDYVSPNEVRAAIRKKTQFKYTSKVAAKEKREENEKARVLPKDEVEDIFRTH